MLDYSTIQIVNPNMGPHPASIPLLIGIIVLGVMIAVFITVNNDNIAGGVAVGLIFSIVCFAFGKHTGSIDNSALIKIEVKDIEISSNIYPSAKKYPYLQKEGDKVYYYDTIWARKLGDPYKIKEDIIGNFEHIVFNLKNSEPQEIK